MAVRVEYYRDLGPPPEAFAIDMAAAIRAATYKGDEAGARRLRELWLDHFDVELPAKGPTRLFAYLKSRVVWRSEGERTVIKTVDQPCIAYTAELDQTHGIALIALGACYRYPASNEDGWWTNVIRPRLRKL